MLPVEVLPERSTKVGLVGDRSFSYRKTLGPCDIFVVLHTLCVLIFIWRIAAYVSMPLVLEHSLTNRCSRRHASCIWVWWLESSLSLHRNSSKGVFPLGEETR